MGINTDEGFFCNGGKSVEAAKVNRGWSFS